MSLLARPLCVLLLVVALGRQSSSGSYTTTDSITTISFEEHGHIWTADRKAMLKLTDGFNTYAYAILGFFAISTNTINFIIMKRQPVLSPYTYLTYLAACDLLTGVAILWNAITGNAGLQRLSEPVAMLMSKTFVSAFFIRDCFALASSLTTAALSLDRMVAVRFPLKRKLWCTVRRARITSTCLMVISFILNADEPLRLTTTGREDVSGKILPRVTYTAIGRRQDVNEILMYTTLVKMVLPLVVMAVSNTVTLRQVAQSHKFRIKITQAQGQSSKGSDQCLAITVGVIITFIVSSIPRFAFKIVTSTRTRITGPSATLIFMFAELLAWTTACSNFVIYCLLNGKFRKDVVDLIKCKVSKQKNKMETTISISTDSKL